MSNGKDQGSMTVNGPSTDPGSQSPRGSGGSSGGKGAANGGTVPAVRTGRRYPKPWGIR